MDDRTKYILALGGFRRAVNALMHATAGLQNAAHGLDPQCQAEDDPIALALFEECLTEMKGMCDLLPGMRQLFAAAIGEP